MIAAFNSGSDHDELRRHRVRCGRRACSASCASWPALLFLQHGTAKHFKFPLVPMFAKLELMSLPGIAGVIEIVGGACF